MCVLSNIARVLVHNDIVVIPITTLHFLVMILYGLDNTDLVGTLEEN